jgi:phosphoribosylformylglycinamidine (FGAM) synthase-like amidotransferase family enzyme
VKPRVNVVYLPGTNCHEETLRAFRHVGAEPRLLFLADALAGRARLDDADILCLPGGFSFGDHLAAGTIAGLLLSTRLKDQFDAARGRLMLAICNGFQIALRAGCFGPGVALKVNACGTFQNVPDQPHQVVTGNPSPWLAGLSGQTLGFPCAHGEGRFVAERTEGWRVALRYPADANPDGSADGVAGITTPDGLAFGLMNHPERALDPQVRLAFFANGVRHARAS